MLVSARTRGLSICDGLVGIRTDHQHVGVCSAVQVVVAVATANRVVTSTGHNHVGSVTTQQRVGVRSTGDRVVATGSTECCLQTGAAGIDRVGRVATIDDDRFHLL